MMVSRKQQGTVLVTALLIITIMTGIAISITASFQRRWHVLSSVCSSQ